MKKITSFPIVIIFLLCITGFCNDVVTTITFPSGDEVIITADTYIKYEINSPFILLFHQAGWSRGEYRETALKLNELGFNCMAIDLRSGNEVNGIKNETKIEADKLKKKTDYINAYADMESALMYADMHFAKGKLIILGSSYSSSLALKLAAENPETVDGVLAFSPGEYFAKSGKSEIFITESVKNLNCPVFITSAKEEKTDWQTIFSAIPSKEKTSFIPESTGNHGSRALWEKFNDSESYWQAVKEFLTQFVLKD